MFITDLKVYTAKIWKRVYQTIRRLFIFIFRNIFITEHELDAWNETPLSARQLDFALPLRVEQIDVLCCSRRGNGLSRQRSAQRHIQRILRLGWLRLYIASYCRLFRRGIVIVYCHSGKRWNCGRWLPWMKFRVRGSIGLFHWRVLPVVQRLPFRFGCRKFLKRPNGSIQQCAWKTFENGTSSVGGHFLVRNTIAGTMATVVAQLGKF
jgi:hypothetical protein